MSEAIRRNGEWRTALSRDDRHRQDVVKIAEPSKNEFLATLAHELRNPLAPIRSAVQILHLKGTLGPESQWALSVIDRQVLHMARLIDDLVDIARITSNRLELRRERVELAAVLRVAVETTAALLEASGQHFALTVPAEPIHLNADPTRLAQAIANLLNNAAKYTPHGGHIWLTGERRSDQVVVTVRDNGIGIPAAMLPCVFDMFTQGEQSQARAHGGLGIGLTLVKRLAELHGGTVTAHSEGPDRGSAFVLRLPIPVDSTACGSPTREDASPSAASSLRILVVDDNQDAADSLAILLQSYGNETRTAYDGLQALEVAAEFRPDVVLLDIGLPKADGHEVARRLRREPWGAGVCVIAVTGWSNENDRARTRDAGFNHHLVKPLDTAELTRLLAPLEEAARGRGQR
jgi:CheY-like chemotaxis protein/two-component sensor histidine kinase